MWVMITGIRDVDDALRAWELGADALGLVVKQEEASGFISPKVARSITMGLSNVAKGAPSLRMRAQQNYQRPSFPLRMETPVGASINSLHSLPNQAADTERFCESVLVTHLTDVQEITHLARTIGVTTIQVVGKSTPEDIGAIKHILPDIKVIKSIPVIGASSMKQVKKYMDVVDAIELDTIDSVTNKFGGTGKTHDWSISQKIVQEYGYKVPIILAGGLDPDNIEKAIQQVKPFGVDVSSGIKDEDSRGIQNERLVASFISKAKDCKCEYV